MIKKRMSWLHVVLVRISRLRNGKLIRFRDISIFRNVNGDYRPNFLLYENKIWNFVVKKLKNDR